MSYGCVSANLAAFKSFRSLILFIFLFVANLSFGQTPVTGTPEFNSFGGGPFDVINLGNLNMHFSIPVVNKTGRGIPFNYNLGYDSSIWTPMKVNNVLTWQPIGGWGWQSQTDAATGYVPPPTLSLSQHICGVHTEPEVFIYFSGFVDSLGSFHHVRNLYLVAPTACWGITTATGTTDDGSAYTITVNYVTLGSYTGTVNSPNGAVQVIPVGLRSGAASVTDPNGNQITTTDGVTFKDTLNTNVLTISGGAPNSSVFTYNGPSGSETVKLNYTPKTVCTNFNAPGIAEYPPTSAYLVTSVTLADSSNYTITYESTPGSLTGCSSAVTGRIASITLPSGGTISYSYEGGPNGYNGIYTDGTTSYISRTTLDGTTTYSRSGSGLAYTTTVVDPQNNYTNINFAEDGSGSGYFYETQRQVYQGASTLLMTTWNCWNNTSTGCATESVSSPITEQDAYRQPAGLASYAISKVSYNSYVLPTEDKEIDYNGTTVLKDTIISYNTSLGNGIINRPASVTVKDGSGNIESMTSYAYDECSVTPSGATQHVSISGSRGNPTTIGVQASSSTTLYRKYTYYDTGNLNQSGDLSTTSNSCSSISNPTTYTYSSTNNASCDYAFPTSIAEPLSLSRSMTWDCNGGLPLSVKDENQNTASYTYDLRWRPTNVTNFDQGTTNITYQTVTPPFSTTTVSAMNLGESVTKVTNFDGLGRVSTSQVQNDPDGNTTVSVGYDGLGRVNAISNPCRTCSTSEPTYGVTQYIYDALGRLVTLTHQDSSTWNASYSGNVTTVTDEGNNSNGTHTVKLYQSDGLGRIASICEVSTTTQANNVAPSTCAQNNSLKGFATTYTYAANSTGSLVSVAQPGLNTRSYQYDRLSRLVQEINPESGTTSYAYDTQRPGDLYTRIRPRANQIGSLQTTTTYTTDALHRITNVAYNDSPQTPSVTFQYDQTSANTFTIQNGLGRLTNAIADNNHVMTTLSYDQMGRVINQWQCTPLGNCSGGQAHFGFAYDYLGYITGFENFAEQNAGQYGYTLSYSYNQAQHLTSIASSWSDQSHPSALL